jgi:glycosyltransferase involved in cell wall biosynthesis
MNNNPLVSVIIPVYNGDRYLKESIESVLAQDYQPLEIIIIDDGSTDNSANIAKSFGEKITYYYQENTGHGGAINYGVELAKGDYLAFLDADDLWEKNKLNPQMKVMLNEPEIDIVSGMVQQFFSPELEQESRAKIYCEPELMKGYVIGTMMIKKNIFRQIGKLNENYKFGSFIDWFINASDSKLNIKFLPELVLKRRLHKTNSTIVSPQNRSDYTKIIKKVLDRRRGKI